MEKVICIMFFMIFLMGNAVATESTKTPKVVGHYPVITDVKLEPQEPRAGEYVRVTYKYSDADGDADHSGGSFSVAGIVPRDCALLDRAKVCLLPWDSGGKKLVVKFFAGSKSPADPSLSNKEFYFEKIILPRN